MDPEKLRQMGRDVEETVKGYLKDDSGWTLAKQTKNITVEKKPSPCAGYTDGFLYRGWIEMGCSRDIIKRYVDPIPADGAPLRLKWDKDVQQLNMLTSAGEGVYILQTLTNSAGMGLISPREFVDILVKADLDNGSMTCGVSTEYEPCPVKPKFVRGWNYPCGNLLMDVPGQPGVTKVMNFFQPDIRGNIPKSMMEKALPISMERFFGSLEEILKKDGHIK